MKIKFIPRCAIVKMPHIKDEKKISKATKEKT